MPLRYRAFLAAMGIVTVSILLVTGSWPWLVVAPAAVFGAAMMMSTFVRLDESVVSIRVAGIFSTAIAYAEISHVSVGPATGLAQGMGLRILSGRVTGYLVGGPSVRIQCKNSAVLVSCADPAELIRLINSRILR